MTVEVAAAGLAETRILRAMAIIFGVASAVFGLLALPTIQIQARVMVGWWSAIALLGMFGLPLGMAVTAWRSQARSIKRWAGAIAVAQLLVLATWIPFMRMPELPADASQPWVFGVTAFGSTAAAMAWRGRYLWLYLPATGVLVLVDRALTSPQLAAIPFDDALYALMFSAVFAALGSICILGCVELDRVAAIAREETAVDAARRAEHQQRARVNALVHDQVLVTLLVAAQTNGQLRGAAAAQARQTLAEIKQFESDEKPTEERPAREFVWQLQAVATATDPGAVFSYEIADDATCIPPDVGQALAEGLAEALRNVLRHAQLPGRDLHRAIHVRVTTSRARVDVLDDGCGFEPSNVAQARLGIAVSIRERMATLPAGSSDVVSVPGQGTRVVLEWVAP